ncbi:MAG TPA: hypothetical protein P5555_04970 [Candidatus Paceibacterota bacterium]|nr:hypothetical protein [Verrucomicrobiota bacterium]HOX00769.1 hypothetical protein [Verrucomicrobiota bacterium]HRZ44523.1 hypothetical protein [Candidatus Paceibacterota bacterium]HRZ91769.1 hypothetical protein [Candidatus Paceibacterota bacterium]
MPNLVTNLVREKGVAHNWVWWSFLLTGMLTVYAALFGSGCVLFGRWPQAVFWIAVLLVAGWGLRRVPHRSFAQSHE